MSSLEEDDKDDSLVKESEEAGDALVETFELDGKITD